MKIAAIVQARMGSRRLPGKVLCPVRGRPMLGYLLERLEHCRLLDGVIVATSVADEDTPITRFCRDRGTECYRGPLENVAQRFLETLEVYRLDGFVRVNGDSPLLDPALVDRAARLWRTVEADLVTNVMPRTYPAGQSVEAMGKKSFGRGCALMEEAEDREHVTRIFYRKAEQFRILNFTSGEDWEDIHLSVDTKEQMATFASIIALMDRPQWEYGLKEVLALRQKVLHPT